MQKMTVREMIEGEKDECENKGRRVKRDEGERAGFKEAGFKEAGFMEAGFKESMRFMEKVSQR